MKLGWNFTETLSLGGGGRFHSERGGVSSSHAATFSVPVVVAHPVGYLNAESP